METNVKNNGPAKVVNTVQADKTPKFVAGNPVNVVAKAQEKVVGKEEESENPVVASQEVTTTEPSKLEIKAALAEQKPALNLEQTLKKIKDLNRLSNQREKLIVTIDNLEGFEILQEDEAEETNLNHFQRCELKITDDNGNVFSTKNPFIIDQVSKNIKGLCTEKLTEVEAQISLNL
ncbi:hypothetical protein CPT03_03290 [Pedobacter ginsengisoli]|uniref:Uncharacterized protein n=1 Tax=Pedobacter ginsengisoli TaxID=363852 RepID=A0A2D1U1S0_9SPHI|nr:hypothetical protein [Pedobacter ginsengisoli]ATP55555.1 hypothetical protein CPT03_03290 [Pedobacter ginsengisoli]